MPVENVHDRKEKRRFTLVVVPSGDSEKTKTISIGKWAAVASVSAAFFVIASLVFAVIIFTPAHNLLPVSHSDLERRYGKQIVEIQEQVNNLLKEMNVLRDYNIRLRKAMGESLTSSDSNIAPVNTGEQILSSTSNKDLTATDATVSARNIPVKSHIGESSSSISIQTYQPTVNELTSTFPLIVPADGYVTRGFDVRQYHYGIDFAGRSSSPIVAAADGNVVFAGWTYDDGFMMMIAHDLGYMTVYKHNAALMKNVGASVRRGEMIALLGNTGNSSSGPHLHFELWKDGIAYNPQQFLLQPQ